MTVSLARVAGQLGGGLPSPQARELFANCLAPRALHSEGPLQRADRVRKPSAHDVREAELTQLRGLEATFVSKVATAWQTRAPTTANMASAKSVALAEYNACRSAATVLAQLVSDVTADPRVRNLEPALPEKA